MSACTPTFPHPATQPHPYVWIYLQIQALTLSAVCSHCRLENRFTHLRQHTNTPAYRTLARYLWKCQQIAASEQQGAAFTFFSKCHKSQMKVRAWGVGETGRGVGVEVGTSGTWNTGEHTSIQNVRELLEANYTKRTFQFRQSSNVESLIK